MSITTDVKEIYTGSFYQERDVDRVECMQAVLEKTCNFFGYLPSTCHTAGLIRLFAGAIIVINSVATVIFSAITDLYIKNPRGYGTSCKRHILHIGHGFGNMVRGLIELSANASINTPAFSLFVPWGWAASLLIVYDHIFALRMKYTLEHQAGYKDPYTIAWDWIYSRMVGGCFEKRIEVDQHIPVRD